MQPSEHCIDLIKKFEGCAKARGDGSFDAYPDPGSGGAPWTIGYGSTGKDIGQGTVWTQQLCDDRLAADLARFSVPVAEMINGAPTTQGQFDALVSFAYNLGAANLHGSTLLSEHRAGRHAEAAAEFGKWVHASGRILPGLIKRRAAEAALYLS